jgi:hypothetical protein
MTQSNLPVGNATSKPVSPRSILMHSGNAVSEYPHVAHLRGSQDAALELAYGCVDWFIYVTESVAIGPMTRASGND